MPLPCPTPADSDSWLPHRGAVTQPRHTGLTRAFSGRLARGMINTFQADHTAAAPIAYPELHHLTTPLRAHARTHGDAEQINLWAGQAHELARAVPAEQLVNDLMRDATTALERLTKRLLAATVTR
ncbi:MAG TPA: nitronate monooxygenase [Microlunatus sp.]